jgi:hypothetical protein
MQWSHKTKADLKTRDFLGQVCWCLLTRQMSMDAWMKEKSKMFGSIDVDLRLG